MYFWHYNYAWLRWWEFQVEITIRFHIWTNKNWSEMDNFRIALSATLKFWMRQRQPFLKENKILKLKIVIWLLNWSKKNDCLDSTKILLSILVRVCAYIIWTQVTFLSKIVFLEHIRECFYDHRMAFLFEEYLAIAYEHIITT